MKNKTLVLQFEDTKQEYYFEKKVFVIEDKKLIENLSKPNIKNADSTLTIKSMHGIHISDVVQVKINMADTGTFFANFPKETLVEEKRKTLLEKISKLKNNRVPTKTTQQKKVSDLIAILNEYRPIFVSFVNNEEIKLNISKLAQLELKFPLLVLSTQDKKFVIKFQKKHRNPGKNDNLKKNKPQRNYEPIALFKIDYFFVFVFALMGSFGITTAAFEIMNKEAISIFLSILGLAFTIVLILSMQSAIYKRGKERNPFLRYYMIAFILVGIAGGVVGGYFTSKGILKTEIENFDYKKMLIYSIGISCVALLSSVYTCIPVNSILKKRSESKNK